MIVGINNLWGCINNIVCLLLIRDFNDVLGVGIFILIKFKNVLKNIVFGIVNIDVMIIVFNVLGNICLKINLNLEVFNVWDVKINFWFFNFKNFLCIILFIFS